MQGLPQIGDVLDETYRIESELGRGGFGAVYLARQISMDREVALKVLVANAMKIDEMIQRFRREVMAVRNLGHPNTIRVYDFRDRADGMLYYAMEYVKGPTLKDVMKEGPMPPARVRHILRQVLKSLAEAHNFGIVHRDLKPANIMIAQMHGETDFVKVLDFGIAKILDGDDAEDREQITSAGVLVGTLNYMSPEQIAGGQITGSSDLYALALIGIEMLSGRSVFEGTGRWEILHKQISDEPVEIPEIVLQSPLGPVFQKALQKRPHERYLRAEDMLAAMDAINVLPQAPLIEPADAVRDISTRRDAAVSSSGPISTSAPISQSGPITGTAAMRDSTPPGHVALSSPDFAAPASAEARTEGSAQISIGAPAAFLDEQTQQVDSSPGFMPVRQPAHTPVPSPTPPRNEDEATDEDGAKTLIPTLSAVKVPASAPSTEPQIRNPSAATIEPMKTVVPAESTARQSVEQPQPVGEGNKRLLIAAAVLIVFILIATVAAFTALSGDTTPPVEEPPTVTAPTPIPERAPVIAVPIEEPAKPVEEPEAPVVEAKQVKIRTGDTRAQVFDGDQLVGSTPIRFPVAEEKTFTLKAEGFQDATVTLSNASDETVEVALVPLPTKAAPAPDAAAGSATKKKKKDDLDWVPITAPKKGDKVNKKVDPNGPKVPVF